MMASVVVSFLCGLLVGVLFTADYYASKNKQPR